MKLGRKPTEEIASTDPVPEPKIAGSRSTRIDDLVVKATTGIMVACLAAGPVALGLQFFGGSSQIVAASSKTDDPSALAAGAYGQGFVMAWLRASRDDSSELKRYLDASTDLLPAQGSEITDGQVSKVTPMDSSGLYSVVVKVRVGEKPAVDPSKPSSNMPAVVWRERYYQTTVYSGQAGMKVSLLPAPITAPMTATFPTLKYIANIPLAGPVGETMQAFFSAYLSGQGDLTRYVSPGSKLQAVTPAPYNSVTVRSITATGEVPSAPADGSKLEVIVTVRLAAGSEAGSSSDYPLVLVARASRWEISEISAGPQISTSQPTPSKSPTPTPTTAPTK
ncbi:MAG: conjugal transfer protein [Renibacterium salmoninarum]|nr:conjugal transfer protein [Renibacterium salmoninarum]